MIDISNATADEIRLVISELYGMTKDVPGNRAREYEAQGDENY